MSFFPVSDSGTEKSVTAAVLFTGRRQDRNHSHQYIYMCVLCDHNQQHQQPEMNGPGSLFSFLFFPLILFFSSSNYRLNLFPSVQSFKRTEKEMQGLSDCDSMTAISLKREESTTEMKGHRKMCTEKKIECRE